MSVFNVYCDEQIDELNLSKLECAIGAQIQADVPLAIELLFVSADEIRSLNADTRGVDKVTDVLSYPTLDGIKGKAIHGEDHPFDIDEQGNLLLGSIVICQDRAKEQAQEYGHSYGRELNYLFVHGVMHCLGYDHMTDEEKSEMRAQEEKILGALGIIRE